MVLDIALVFKVLHLWIRFPLLISMYNFKMLPKDKTFRLTLHWLSFTIKLMLYNLSGKALPYKDAGKEVGT